jgi:hypothetical protein
MSFDIMEALLILIIYLTGAITGIIIAHHDDHINKKN